MKDVIIYTDGCCKGNPGTGAYAFIILYKDYIYKNTGFEKYTTNNKMELLAVIKGIKTLKEPCNITIYTDSKYIVNAFQNKWIYKWEQNNWCRNKNKPIKNQDLWKVLFQLSNYHNLQFIWVKGHNGNKYNEMCDEMANAVIKKYKQNKI